MFDYFSIQSSTENPTLVLILFTVLLTLLLASILAFVYEKTSKDISRPDFYIQSLVLVAIVAATVMQAIGDSLARGLGMLGALAIIRFRTTLRNPRNMIFMFAAIATGIACGVYGFVIAIVGTISFSIMAFILSISPFGKEAPLIGSLRFSLPENSDQLPVIKNELKTFCKKSKIERYRLGRRNEASSTDQQDQNTENEVSDLETVRNIQYNFDILLKEKSNATELLNKLESIEDIQNVRLNFRKLENNI